MTSALGTAAASNCPICGESVEAFAEFNERPKARCPTCGGVERHRVLALIYDEFLREEFDLEGKRVLAVSPSVCEKRLLERYGLAEVRSLDIRPELSPDIVADVCHMPEVPRMSYDCVIASYVLTCVYDLDAALAEIHRVLKPRGRFLFSDPLTFGAPIVEHEDEEKITKWYGKETYDTYRVGSFRALGDEGILERLARGFVTKTFYGRDPVTGAKVVWHSASRRVPRALVGDSGD